MTKIKFDIDSAEIVNDEPDSQFATARLLLFSSGDNRHNMTCSEKVLKKTAKTAYEKPVIFEIKYGGDFGTHSNKNVPAGFIVPNSADFVRQEDGRLSLYVLGKIWKMYSGAFIDVFYRKKTDTSKVSVEMELIESERAENGKIEMKDFSYTAACVLGDAVTEASPGANIQMLSFEYREAVRKEFGEVDRDEFEIPENIKKNASVGLNLYKSIGGSTTIAISMARRLIKNRISLENVRAISKYLASHKEKVDGDENNPTRSYMNYMLYGGNDAIEWTKNILNSGNAYFDIIGFPYKSREDMNPALKGIEPPITSEQGNEIARQAESIGENGWAIAISSFKKRHKVVDGRWVRKNSDETKEEEDFTVDDENKEKENFEDENVGENKEEETEEKPEEKKEEEEKSEEKDEDEEEDKDEMSFSFDMDFCMTMLGSSVEEYSKDGTFDFAKLCSAMCGKMAEMKTAMDAAGAEKETYMQENMSLKEFKEDVEKRQFSVMVDNVLGKLSTKLPKDIVDEARKDSENYNVETFSAWENKTKAIAFSCLIEDDSNNGVVKIGLPHAQKDDNRVSSSPWRR